MASAYPIDSSLRGWSWGSPPVKPRAFLGLSVHDVASYCSTHRDVWLRRVVGVRGVVNDSIRFGGDVHSVISCVLRGVRSCFTGSGGSGDFWRCSQDVIEDCICRSCSNTSWRGRVEEVAKLTALIVGGEYLWSRAGLGVQPFLGWLTEVTIDGSPIGLSQHLRADAIVMGNLVLDFKVGKPFRGHELMLTAYAMAVEANLEVPVDYAFIVYLSFNGGVKVRVKGIYVGPDLRREFIDVRDEVIDIILSEREPPKPANCPKTCPYIGNCGGN